MLLNIIKVVLFLLVNAAGYFAVPTIIALAAKFNLIPFVEGPDFQAFQFLLLTVPIPLWACTAVVSIGYFFTAGELRSWLLLAPLYVTVIYGIGAITYFHFV
ncbi:MAG: hypothetical protein NDJ24_00760 [Alphaproteobacteria bacterium]|nr:hypothetical protein [Alphaproteobacteria bacterium]